MHNIDRTLMEYTPEMQSFETEQFEYQPEVFGEAGAGEVFGEAELMELAAELLEVQSEQELDRFLGDLVSRAGRAVGRFVSSPTGQALGGLLKGAAKRALPVAGAALGTYLGGPAGAQIGGQLASAAGQMFGLELEGLSGEDREFEVAKGFVRFASEAVKNATASPAGADPRATATAAAVAAAKQYAPGLLAASAGTATEGVGALAGRGRSGRWIRRGNRIVLLGV